MFLRYIAARMFDRPLLVLPEYAQVMATALADRLNVEPQVSQEVVERYRRPNDRMQVDKRNGIAVLPIVGGTVHRGDGPEADSGVQSYTAIQNRLTELLDDPNIRGILLDIDSGGGEAAGIQELGRFISKASVEKPIWSIANTTAASAAYWLASSAQRVYAAPGARVGSIGVYVQHIDLSKMMEKKGVVSSFIFAGKHKVDGNPFEALPDNVRADIQEGVNALWDEFAGYVGVRRDLSIETVQGFEAKVFTADQAREHGLVDGVATLGEALSDFNAYLNRPKNSGLSLGDTMVERLNHSDSDIATARAEGHEAGVREATANHQAAVNKMNGEFAVALTTMFPDSKKAAVFAKAVTKGMAISDAAELAADIEDAKPVAAAPAPEQTATERDAVAILKANAPNVRGDESQENIDPREQRLAELKAATRAHNVAHGYVAR